MGCSPQRRLGRPPGGELALPEAARRDPHRGAANWRDAPGGGALPPEVLSRISMIFFCPTKIQWPKKKSCLCAAPPAAHKHDFFFASHDFFFWRGRRPGPGPGQPRRVWSAQLVAATACKAGDPGSTPVSPQFQKNWKSQNHAKSCLREGAGRRGVEEGVSGVSRDAEFIFGIHLS